jgi:hypothetical protein
VLLELVVIQNESQITIVTLTAEEPETQLAMHYLRYLMHQRIQGIISLAVTANHDLLFSATKRGTHIHVVTDAIRLATDHDTFWKLVYVFR